MRAGRCRRGELILERKVVRWPVGTREPRLIAGTFALPCTRLPGH